MSNVAKPQILSKIQHLIILINLLFKCERITQERRQDLFPAKISEKQKTKKKNKMNPEETTPSSLNFANIYHDSQKGQLVFNQNQLIYTPDRPGIPATTVQKDDIISAEFVAASRGPILRVYLEKSAHDFFGLRKNHFESFSKFFQQNYGHEVTLDEMSSKGLNWGEISIKETGKRLLFNIDAERALDIPLESIKNVVTNPKSQELVVEFTDPKYRSKGDDTLIEMRFTFPKESATDAEDGTAGSNADNQDSISKLEKFHKQLKETADFGTEKKDAIVSFQNLLLSAPRGRYAVSMFEEFMRLRGKTHEFKISFSSIEIMFMLFAPDGVHVYVVLYLSIPINPRFGRYVVLVFEKSTQANAIKLNMPYKEFLAKFPKPPQQSTSENAGEDKKDNEEGSSKTTSSSSESSGAKEEPELNGKLYDVVARTFRGLSGKKLIGTGKFASATGNSGVKCSVKASEGSLFFLERSIVFLPKPTLYLRHSEVAVVSFKRTNREGGARFFDMEVTTKSKQKHVFLNIDKAEYDILAKWIAEKGIKVENAQPTARSAADAEMEAVLGSAENDEDEEDDEDFVEEGVDDKEDDKDFDEFVGSDNPEMEVSSKDADQEADGTSEKKRKRKASDNQGEPEAKKQKTE